MLKKLFIHLLDANKVIAHTDAYTKLKKDAQGVFDFLIVTCHSVPAYKMLHKEYLDGERSFIPRPDHFSEGQICQNRVRELAKDYKKSLARYALISTFSFFESYVQNVIREFCEFHGHEYLFELLPGDLKQRAAKTTQHKAHRKLRERPNNANKEKYSAALAKIRQVGGTVAATELFSAYGLQMLKEKMGSNFDKLKAVDIPIVLESAFLFKMPDSQEYRNIREKRNAVAHGNRINLSISDVVRYNHFLRKLSVSIDSHLLTYFFVVEKV